MFNIDVIFSLTSDQFETLRLYIVIAVVLFRLALLKKYLQTYLDTAFYKVNADNTDFKRALEL